MRRILPTALVILSLGALQSHRLDAQSLTTGAIVGVVADPSGAVVPKAEVSVRNIETGQERTTTTGSSGAYVFSQLGPGRYRVSVKVFGFRTAQFGPIVVGVSRTANADIFLQLGAQTDIVEVTAAPDILEPSNPNTTTTVNSQVIEALPNPGNDLTYVAQVAPGAIMNTGGGNGLNGNGTVEFNKGNNNVEFNGLPATSINLTIDGLDGNNLGAINQSMGLNAISEVSVNTLSYSVDQGRYGAVQVNFISKAGSNNWHGNVFEIWNGSHLNATNWFLNAQPGPPCGDTNSGKCKPFSNANQFGASLGGPLIRNKLFLFADVEGVRIALPLIQNETYPSQAYKDYVLSQIPEGGYDPKNGVTYAPPPHPAPAIAYYKQAFALYGNPSGGIPLPERDCPIQGDGTIVTLAPGVPTPHGSGCILNRTFGASSKASDLYTRFRVDQNINAANRVWYAVKFQTGVQPDWMDPVNSVFNAYSSQPQTGVSIGYTHIFNPDLVNEFNPGFNWGRATYQPTNFAAARAASPFLFQGAGLDRIFAGAAIWPAGSDTTTWQLIDNLTWRYGAHTLKFGENLLRTLLSDHNLGSGTTPRIRLGDAVQYSLDVVGGFATQAFAPSLSEPFGFASLDLYAQDTWKVTRRLTFNYGLRATWNGNPVEQHSNFGQLASGFYDIPHDVNQPLNKVLLTGQRYEFPSTQIIQWQPRVAVAWQTRPHTVFRAGAGLFSDVFGSVLADNLMLNFPPQEHVFCGRSGNRQSHCGNVRSARVGRRNARQSQQR